MITQKLRHICNGVVVIGLLGACTPKPEPKTVDYYVSHKAERDKVNAACSNNPGGMKDDPDCRNAGDAVIKAWGTTKLPPIDFGKK